MAFGEEAPTRVVVADGHPLVRVGVASAIDGEEFVLVGEAHTGLEALALVSELKPDLLILELDLVGPPPSELIRHCHELHPGLKILVFSNQAGVQHIAPLRGAGIVGFVAKKESPELLLQALRVVRSGESWFSHSVLVGSLSPQRPQWTLTEREQQVLDHIVQGKSNYSIAEELSISKQTVRRHATLIYEKMGVANRVQAVLQAREFAK